MNHLSNIEATNFAKSVNVSRETLAKFQLYAELLKHWQKKINLIGSNTTDSLWERHFLDSAQLMRCIPKNLESGPVYDIGSGAGFPGLVLAIMGLKHMHLVDSDSRKCVFLNEVVVIEFKFSTGSPIVSSISLSIFFMWLPGPPIYTPPKAKSFFPITDCMVEKLFMESFI